MQQARPSDERDSNPDEKENHRRPKIRLQEREPNWQHWDQGGDGENAEFDRLSLIFCEVSGKKNDLGELYEFGRLEIERGQERTSVALRIG